MFLFDDVFSFVKIPEELISQYAAAGRWEIYRSITVDINIDSQLKISYTAGHYGIFLSLLFSKICTYVSLVTFLVVFYRTISFFKVFISSFTFSIVFYSSIFFLEFSFTKVFGFMLKVTVHLMFCLNSAPHYSHLILFPTIIRFVYIRRAQRRKYTVYTVCKIL